ncbi:MAG: hypothetical protein K9L65_02685 [Chromatiaceae bacterium]|nr:hypothetical protein [Chromatiaceae bacterium]
MATTEHWLGLCLVCRQPAALDETLRGARWRLRDQIQSVFDVEIEVGLAGQAPASAYRTDAGFLLNARLPEFIEQLVV